MFQKFFDERSDQSEVKARIVEKYFYVWAKVIKGAAQKGDGRIGYIDLYAGPGRYKDGAASTPLLVIEHAIEDADMSQMLVAYLNDIDQNNTSTLEAEINALPGISKLKHKPQISCSAVDEDAESFFYETRLIPSFSFIDPFGYKGLSLKLIHGVIKDWGCDCVFFFNYARINAGITNPTVKKHIDALFGEERANFLREKLPGLSPPLREALILEEIANLIKGLGGKFVLPFTFKTADGSRTSHKLIFVSKHFKGYEIMKDIMASESSTTDQGVPSFEYSPADESMPLLFSLSRPLETLAGSLLEEYSGQEISLDALYRDHSVDTPYIKKNYRSALEELEGNGEITAYSTTGKRRGITYPSHVLIQFP
ncbi:MAG: three-Cys-motif partner protein TcmP [Alphaproteobacteria bacterium]|nr:MAG: three-Cys-motif partner protein TcmP [Alphaproteobacteria bacterium]